MVVKKANFARKNEIMVTNHKALIDHGLRYQEELAKTDVDPDYVMDTDIVANYDQAVRKFQAASHAVTEHVKAGRYCNDKESEFRINELQKRRKECFAMAWNIAVFEARGDGKPELQNQFESALKDMDDALRLAGNVNLVWTKKKNTAELHLIHITLKELMASGKIKKRDLQDDGLIRDVFDGNIGFVSLDIATSKFGYDEVKKRWLDAAQSNRKSALDCIKDGKVMSRRERKTFCQNVVRRSRRQKIPTNALTIIHEGQKFVERLQESDGNCMGRSCSDQVNQDDGKDHEKYREMAVEYMEAHPEEFKPFLVFGDPDHDEKDADAKDWESYLITMSTDGEWMGNHELQAIAASLRRTFKVFVVSPEGKVDPNPRIVGDTTSGGATMFLAFRNIEGKNHYNSLGKVVSAIVLNEAPADKSVEESGDIGGGDVEEESPTEKVSDIGEKSLKTLDVDQFIDAAAAKRKPAPDQTVGRNGNATGSGVAAAARVGYTGGCAGNEDLLLTPGNIRTPPNESDDDLVDLGLEMSSLLLTVQTKKSKARRDKRRAYNMIVENCEDKTRACNIIVENCEDKKRACNIMVENCERKHVALVDLKEAADEEFDEAEQAGIVVATLTKKVAQTPAAKRNKKFIRTIQKMKKQIEESIAPAEEPDEPTSEDIIDPIAGANRFQRSGESPSPNNRKKLQFKDD